MTRAMKAGLLVAAVHCAIAGSVAAKYAVDRATLPRAWVRTVPVDPTMPIRGRYVQLALAPELAPAAARAVNESKVPVRVSLRAREGRLVADPATGDDGFYLSPRPPRGGAVQPATLARTVPYFIPDGVSDPSIRAAAEELWVEVSLPKKGPPRPLRLGVMKDGRLTPLSF